MSNIEKAHGELMERAAQAEAKRQKLLRATAKLGSLYGLLKKNSARDVLESPKLQALIAKLCGVYNITWHSPEAFNSPGEFRVWYDGAYEPKLRRKSTSFCDVVIRAQNIVREDCAALRNESMGCRRQARELRRVMMDRATCRSTASRAAA